MLILSSYSFKCFFKIRAIILSSFDFQVEARLLYLLRANNPRNIIGLEHLDFTKIQLGWRSWRKDMTFRFLLIIIITFIGANAFVNWHRRVNFQCISSTLLGLLFQKRPNWPFDQRRILRCHFDALLEWLLYGLYGH